MTAEPAGRPSDPGRDPAAIRDMLPPGDRADLARFYAEAAEAARLGCDSFRDVVSLYLLGERRLRCNGA